MGLKYIRGDSEIINKKLILYAFENSPSLLIDCANVADPHALFPFVEQEKLHQVYVIQVELIYKFRDTLKYIPELTKGIKLNAIVITTFSRLFNYDDDSENYHILEHAWELIYELSLNYNLVVGVKGAINEKFADYYSKII